MKYSKISIITIFVLGMITGTVFIINNNDHKECDTQVKNMVDDHGNAVVVEEHICNEKYNF